MMTLRNHRAASVVPESAPAGSFVQGLAAQDFARLGDALAAGACLRALLPSGLRGPVLRGLVSLPVVLGPGRRRG